MGQTSNSIALSSHPKAGDAILTKAMTIVSGLCLAGFIYFSGKEKLTQQTPEPTPPPIANALGGSANKTTSVNDVVTKALAFKALLTSTQQTTLEMTYTTTLARKWSNLPCGASCRNGIQFGTLTSAQLTAALDLIKAALGNASGDGYDEFDANRMAEAYLHANGGGSGYDSTLRWVAFLNTPTNTGTWMLQFGGHHYAANIAFNNGHVIGATPFFQGLEPLSFTYNSKSYAPLNDEHDAFTAMLASLSSTELTSAKLSTTFSDCLMSPGESNGNTNTFPTTKQGLSCAGLTTAQKNLVLAAIKHYTDDMDTATANNVYARYASEINSTYIAFTGSGTAGNASTFLNANSNYVRIDGPTVWIELACQNGVVLSGIHYHTVWRDHSHDYGVDLAGDAIDVAGTTGISAVLPAQQLSIYPNPANSSVNISLAAQVSNARVDVMNMASGQIVRTTSNFTGSKLQINIDGLAAGNYVVRIVAGSEVYNGRFVKE